MLPTASTSTATTSSRLSDHFSKKEELFGNLSDFELVCSIMADISGAAFSS